ncbi:4-(cytidine 5'-diphospho)-2-C-methyl-D-erythritol kinase [Parabacteroides sp. Marseille-P3160]|uniref:4-(cytidine 5'-diphospho)-2-C-methyl-D-erythritol kinase n=1 Tax=Parabacteroides sp. Marseille-P3160 TaxID=1917887 RepID=UPI0009BBE638|nr:4-(cytidine 5'-diphospho)-2-C-methyl-D-erythritol kinase [Parabacteroides sp. Marseille-P3160]
MICFPNAKLNLGLHITGKRPDGYHDIETVFYPVPLKDALEIVPATAFSFNQSGLQVDAPVEQNLVVKALRLLEQQHAIPPLAVYLKKAIPFGAGLGGGSSDAAHLLKLVNDYAQLGLDNDSLEALATRIGADCPFFIRNTPVFASGIGTIFEPIQLSLKGYYLCLVRPDITISTRDAYAQVKPAEPTLSLKELACQPVREWKGRMANDFEASVFSQYPLIGKIKEQLYAAGAVYAAMSGSGSSVFGLFEQPVKLKRDYPDYFVWEGALE